MAILNMTAAANALKQFYLPGLREQMNYAADPLLAELERDTESVQGKEIVMALRYGKQGGTGNRADDGDLPTPNPRKTVQAKWETKNVFSRIQISDKTIQASHTNVGAFANLLEKELDDAMTDAKDGLSRQVYGDGTGFLATCASGTNVATITVDTVQYLVEGQIVDITDSSGVPITNGTARDITAVDETNLTFTVSGSANLSPTATSKVIVNGNYNQELTGLAAVLTPNNTIYGLSRATYPWFNPSTIAVNGLVSELNIQKALDDAERRTGAIVDYLSTSYGVRRSYQNLLTSTKSHVNTLELKGGWKALAYAGGRGDIPMVATKYAPNGKLRALSRKNWKMYEMDDWNWLDEDGAVLSRVSGKAVWEATLAKYCDLGCDLPRGNVDLTGLTEA